MAGTKGGRRQSGFRCTLDLPEGGYIVVPLELGAELPSDIVPLACGVWLAYRECEPVRSAATNEMVLLSEGNDGSLERMEDGLLRRHALVVAAEAGLQGSTEIGDYDAEAVLTRQGLWFEPVLRLVPAIERPLAALLIAQPTVLEYSCCLRMSVGEEGLCRSDHACIGDHLAGYLQCLESPYGPPTFDAATATRELLLGMARCTGKHQRPVAAADIFYHALLQGDWRVRLLLLVIALESLFGSTNELAHQISERAATVAYGRDRKRTEAYRCLRKLYSLRSGFVHGSGIDTDSARLPDVRSKLAFLEETVRLCLLRILRDADMAKRFCGRQDGLDAFLDEEVLAP
jgi:hypothetical protein